MNKEICKKCFEQRQRKFDPTDMDLWMKGYIICDAARYVFVIDVNKSPPKGCPYVLEYLMVSQDL